MKTPERRLRSDIPLRIRNEAAAWIVQLHASDRTPNVDAALREWLAQSPVHRQAFETAGDLWHAGATLPVSVAGRIGRTAGLPAPASRRPALMAATLAGLAVIAGLVYQLKDPSLATAVGEQRTLTLEDGTRVTLNTSTLLTVSYDQHVRRIVLKMGEALFEVAKEKDRPFVVAVADHQVTALGTAFMVRHERKRTAVTLVEGKVSVAPLDEARVAGAQPGASATVLQAGQRLTFDDDTRPALDRPAMERLTAWKRGQAAFQNTPLPDAIDEMNRYSEKKLVIGDATAAATRVSGIFRVGESETFALALLGTYPLKTIEQGNALVIYGAEGADRGR